MGGPAAVVTRIVLVIAGAMVGGAAVALWMHGKARATKTGQTAPTTLAAGRGLVSGVIPLQLGAGLNLDSIQGARPAAQPVPGDPLLASVPGTLGFEWGRA